MYLHRGICIYVCMCRCTCWIYKTLWNLVYIYGILRSFLLGCFVGIMFIRQFNRSTDFAGPTPCDAVAM